ncbi:multidrug resistance-associated protein 4-like [Sinocyclocheilus grahami]|uniref:multidrug resistance-associated protein 4-like n=1 Tax=Sinocyclocheilus grahami TaxID=75366 RepID=UPI0007ACE4DD|nr:PREDICTED: multidrug resistance-associated protein 4-like [Sinocyclocheilus grahami]
MERTGAKAYWDHEVEKATKELRTPKLTKAIIRCYWRSYAVLGVFTLIEEVIKVIQPVFLGKLIQYFERNEPDNMAALYEAYGYAAGVSLSTLGLALLHHLYFYHVQRAGMKIRIAMCHMIYRKALCLSATAMGQTTTGQIVNLLSNDVSKFDEVGNFHNFFVFLLSVTVTGCPFPVFEAGHSQGFFDMELLPDGDLTVIGDRGATLSGGQKARVNLARAVYQDADVKSTDCPCRCICGILKEKPRILVTHQLQYLKAADQILVLKEGHMVARGTYSELQRSGVDFTSLLKKDEEEEGEKGEAPRSPRSRTLSQNSVRSHSSSVLSVKDESDQLPAEPVHTMAEETRTEGTIGLRMYWKYFRAGANVIMLISFVLLNLLAQAFYILHDWWLSYWANSSTPGLCVIETNCSLNDFSLVISGRILNRFSKDIGHLDSLLPWTFVDFIQVFLQIIGVIAVASSVIPWILIPVLPLLISFLFLRRYFLRTSRDVKRIESTSRSPVFSHLSSSLQGLCTIRAFKAEERFQQTFDAHQDLHSEAWFLFLTTSRWFAVRLDGMCSVFVTITAFGCLLLKDSEISIACTLLTRTQFLRSFYSDSALNAEYWDNSGCTWRRNIMHAFYTFQKYL